METEGPREPPEPAERAVLLAAREASVAERAVPLAGWVPAGWKERTELAAPEPPEAWERLEEETTAAASDGPADVRRAPRSRSGSDHV